MKFIKKIILLIVTINGLFSEVKSQTQEEWLNQKQTQIKYLAQQVAALQLYLGYVEKGYQVAQQGLSIIEKIKDGSFNLHQDFFNALKQVNAHISNDGKAKAIAVYLDRAAKDFESFNRKSQSDENFTPDEKKHLHHLYQALAAQCKNSLDELTLVLTSGELEMKDGQRLQKINLLFEDALEKYAFVQAFSKNSQLLARQREKEIQRIDAIENIHGL